MPVALTKRKLDSMKPGQILEVVGDCAPAFANIQKWAKNQGYEIVEASQSKVDFIIKIKKAIKIKNCCLLLRNRFLRTDFISQLAI